MWPWGHLAIAYLCYSIARYRLRDRPPRALPVIALAIGSQFPDLIDKPFAWSFEILPGGRTLTHSVFVAALLLPSVYLLARRFDRPDAGVAFVVGHVSHLLADIPPNAILTADASQLTFLVWPLLPPPPYEEVDGILAGFLRYSMGWYEWAQLGLALVALLVWYRDGRPGLGYVRRSVTIITRKTA
ncbi:membrane-bound metal-dependent hydrolase [Haloterrigena turkmenica DSM 5511]|uniref:Membrane-bound metal-dependent hydrolase n=1 Tax=Haloterrigena turkmenica (strain ATCC 51198 / DSM 5511 / JCM 9101 / NCIMB 13204 / VKM B-1734 / 4k) TaxID=543526 RepID=D2RPD8_HALTV|nr:metal-dependent hydrolase [Haloterrigena turkmenica]ADB60172.1 membrane-bound metal-dependent hydrolase [Haloterrigena turkmenica DSM 5511]